MNKKIIDNPSTQGLVHVTKLFRTTFNLLDRIPLIYKSPKLRTFRESFKDIEKLMHIPNLPDQFNNFFSRHGWICFDSLSLDIVERSIQLAEQGKFEDAHELLINTVDEKFIDFILLRCKNRDHFISRLPLLELLKDDYLADRFHACIPLLLALIDGLANDISKHLGFFTEGLKLELFDSITAHSTGLPFLKQMMNSSRKETNEDEINIPYRNGILHGRDLNFNNKEVASKCWWALTALIDWADKLSNPTKPTQQLTLMESIKKLHEKNKIWKKTKLWTPRPNFSEQYWKQQTLGMLDPNTPEYKLLFFLTAWKNKHWGKIAPILRHMIGENPRHMAGTIKNDYARIDIIEYYLKSAEEQTASFTLFTVNLVYSKSNEILSEDIDIAMVYANSITGHAEIHGQPNGQWYIVQSCLASILFNE